jgi:hypothetical protein
LGAGWGSATATRAAPCFSATANGENETASNTKEKGCEGGRTHAVTFRTLQQLGAEVQKQLLHALIRLRRCLEQRCPQRGRKVLRLLHGHLASAGEVALVASDGNKQIVAENGLQLRHPVLQLQKARFVSHVENEYSSGSSSVINSNLFDCIRSERRECV